MGFPVLSMWLELPDTVCTAALGPLVMGMSRLQGCPSPMGPQRLPNGVIGEMSSTSQGPRSLPAAVAVDP